MRAGLSTARSSTAGANRARDCEADPRTEVAIRRSGADRSTRRELRKRCARAKEQRRAKCAQDTAMPIHGECFHVFLQICQFSLPAKYGRESDTKAFSVCVKRSPKRAASSPGRSDGYGGGSGSGPKKKNPTRQPTMREDARSARRRTATGFSGANIRRCVHKRDQTDRSDCRQRNPLAARNAHLPPRIFGRG